MVTGIWLQRAGWLRGVWGECIAEFWGMFVLIAFGLGTVAIVVIGGIGLSNPVFANWFVINFGWGLAVMFGVYVAGAVSGAHLNPAVTLAFALRRGFPWGKVLPYWAAQLVGAFAAAAVVYYDYRGELRAFEATNHVVRGVAPAGPYATVLSSPAVTETKLFFSVPAPFESVLAAFGDQVLGTALLVGLIFVVVDTLNQPPQANLAPFIIGLIIVVLGTSFGLNAGYPINPARDLGPRLFAFAVGFGRLALPGPADYMWVPLVGPLVGGPVGAILYDFTLRPVLLARGAQPSGTATEIGLALRELPEEELVRLDQSVYEHLQARGLPRHTPEPQSPTAPGAADSPGGSVPGSSRP
jgi:glycerol uptake facilitator protein